MANTILTPTMILREVMRHFYNNCRTLEALNNNFERHFTSDTVKPGQSIFPRRPTNYTVSTGAALAVQDHTETVQPITILPQRHVDVSFTRNDLTLSLEDFTERFTKQAAIRLAHYFDTEALNFMYVNTPWMLGTPGVVPTTYKSILQAEGRLVEEGTPDDGNKNAILTPATMIEMVDQTKGLFNDTTLIARQYRTGIIGVSAGMTWWRSQNLPVHTVGPLGGSPVVAGAGQGLLTGWADYTDLNTSGWTASGVRLNRGDVITIAGVNAVNLRNGQSFGVLRHFVVTATGTPGQEGNVSADAGGLATVRLRPALIAGGAYQNVTARPNNGAVITVIGAANTVSPQNLIVHQDAFNVAIVPMMKPEGVHFAGALADQKTGLSMSLVRQYDINTDAIPCRVDMLYGFGVGERQMSVRLAS
jgi:hypothetical protein